MASRLPVRMEWTERSETKTLINAEKRLRSRIRASRDRKTQLYAQIAVVEETLTEDLREAQRLTALLKLRALTNRAKLERM